MDVPALNRQTMSNQLVAHLRSAVLSGEITPGAPVVESTLAARFGVSRGPLREAMQHLIDEGILVTVPYKGTRVLDISVADIQDIYEMRICLERFAFQHIWDRRDRRFADELQARNRRLLGAIDAGEDAASIEAELSLHSLAYEWTGNKLLLKTWQGIRGRLQLYWAAHHKAHNITGPLREAHDDYIALACGDDLDAMLREIDAHMRRGLDKTRAFLMSRGGKETA
jgi:DNA-binding GntR family transcriptional regulator